MNIYLHELKSYFKNTILWICVLCCIVVVMMFFYPVIKNDIDTYHRILDNFPPMVKAAMGIIVENFSSALGFYGFAFTYASLFGAIQAMNLGIGMVSKEQRERTADFLMTKPVSRTKILTAKLFSVLTILLVTNVVFTAVSAFLIAGMSSDSGFDAGKFALITASLFLLQLILFSLGLVVSILAKKIKSVLPVSLGLVFMFFAISAFAVTAEDDKLRFLTPFQYFKTEYILSHGRYEMSYAVTGLIIAVVSIVFSYMIYKRKDIHAV